VSGGACGNVFDEGLAPRPLFVTECGEEGDAAYVSSDLVLLEWGGGTTPLYPSQEFEALDLSRFRTAEGGTLADDAELFKESVRLQVTRIYCDASAPPIVVRQADAGEGISGTTIYYTQVPSPLGQYQVGEGEYDPCNKQHDNVAVIFGEQIRRIGGVLSFDEWVLVFANITAHEIGHTLGYAHIARSELAVTGRSVFVELMLDGHTLGELRSEQRFTAGQVNCP
jgi:hypothetical protein